MVEMGSGDGDGGIHPRIGLPGNRSSVIDPPLSFPHLGNSLAVIQESYC